MKNFVLFMTIGLFFLSSCSKPKTTCVPCYIMDKLDFIEQGDSVWTVSTPPTVTNIQLCNGNQLSQDTFAGHSLTYDYDTPKVSFSGFRYMYCPKH